MAHKKGEGSTSNGRDSNSKRLGVKLFGGQLAIAGNILVRQRGTKFHPGKNVGVGKDWTLYALTDGIVSFSKTIKDRNVIHVIPVTSAEVIAPAATAPVVKAKAAPKAAPAPKAAEEE